MRSDVIGEVDVRERNSLKRFKARDKSMTLRSGRQAPGQAQGGSVLRSLSDTKVEMREELPEKRIHGERRKRPRRVQPLSLIHI